MHTPTPPHGLCLAHSLSLECFPLSADSYSPVKGHWPPISSQYTLAGCFLPCCSASAGGSGCVVVFETSHRPHMNASSWGSFYLISNFSRFCFVLFLAARCTMGDFCSPTRIEHTSPAVEAGRLNCWATREAPGLAVFMLQQLLQTYHGIECKICQR